MKFTKTFFLLLIVSAVFAACKRDYVCTCYFYKNTETFRTDSNMLRLTKKDAIYYCDLAENTARKAAYNGDRQDTVLRCNLEKL
jgi:hypothetical protein